MLHLLLNWLKLNSSTTFADQVFTWYGATVEMDGETETHYTADEVSSLLKETSSLSIRNR